MEQGLHAEQFYLFSFMETLLLMITITSYFALPIDPTQLAQSHISAAGKVTRVLGRIIKCTLAFFAFYHGHKIAPFNEHTPQLRLFFHPFRTGENIVANQVFLYSFNNNFARNAKFQMRNCHD